MIINKKTLKELSRLTYTQAFDLISSTVNYKIELSKYYAIIQQLEDTKKSKSKSVVTINKGVPATTGEIKQSELDIENKIQFFKDRINDTNKAITIANTLIAYAKEHLNEEDYNELYELYINEGRYTPPILDIAGEIETPKKNRYNHIILYSLMDHIYKEQIKNL